MKTALKILLACSLPTLVSCYPARICKHAIDKQINECRIVESFADEMRNRFWRLTKIDGNCLIDGYIEDEYVTFMDNGCDGKVDQYIDRKNVQFREDFGNSIDSLFLQVKDNIGDYALVEQEEKIYTRSFSPTQLPTRKLR